MTMFIVLLVRQCFLVNVGKCCGCLHKNDDDDDDDDDEPTTFDREKASVEARKQTVKQTRSSTAVNMISIPFCWIQRLGMPFHYC